MKKTFLIAPAIFLLAAGCSSQPAQTQSTTNNSQTQSTAQSQSNANPSSPSTGSGPSATPTQSIKFTDQPYYKTAYLISDATLSSDAQKALIGFQMSKKSMPDGTTQITLKALKTEYQDQQYSLKTGDQLYFIERFMGDDDQESNEDKTVKDDMAIVVDAQGNVVGQPGGWSN